MKNFCIFEISSSKIWIKCIVPVKNVILWNSLNKMNHPKKHGPSTMTNLPLLNPFLRNFCTPISHKTIYLWFVFGWSSTWHWMNVFVNCWFMWSRFLFRSDKTTVFNSFSFFFDKLMKVLMALKTTNYTSNARP